MPGVWLVVSKVTFLVSGLLQRGHGEGVPVSATEEELGGSCLALHPMSSASYDTSNPLLHTRVTTRRVGWGRGVNRRPVEEKHCRAAPLKKKNLTQRKCSWKETKLPQLPLEIALFKMQSADVFR